MDNKDEKEKNSTIQNFFLGNVNRVIHAENYYEGGNKEHKSKLTDEQIGNAIMAINGKDKPLSEKQLFLGVICVLLSKYGWSGKWATCCNRINSLPMKDSFEKECDSLVSTKIF